MGGSGSPCHQRALCEHAPRRQLGELRTKLSHTGMQKSSQSKEQSDRDPSVGTHLQPMAHFPYAPGTTVFQVVLGDLDINRR